MFTIETIIIFFKLDTARPSALKNEGSETYLLIVICSLVIVDDNPLSLHQRSHFTMPLKNFDPIKNSRNLINPEYCV